MSVPNHSILPVTEADIPTIAGFLQASKLQLAINRFLFKDWPNDSAQLAQYTGAVEGGHKDPLVTTLKAVDNRSGEIVGHLGVSRRNSKGGDAETPAAGETDGEQKIPEFFVPEVLSTVARTVRELDRDMEGIEHIQIKYIYVKPSSRKQGIGAQLVRLALNEAKAAGVPLAVLSEPASHDFFLKQGLKDIKHVDIDLSKWAAAHSGFGVFRLTQMSMSG